MNPINKTQITIFLGTFLAVSVVSNLFLYTGNANKQSQIHELTERIGTLDQRLSKEQSLARNNATKINSVGDQQQELRIIAGELQNQLVTITKDYQASLITAEQTQEQLQRVEEQRQNLEAKINEQQQLLSDANKVIANQQRFIRSQSDSQSDSDSNLKKQQALTELTTQLNSDYDEVLFRQRADGAAVIEISLATLFTGASLELLPEAEPLLKKVSQTLKNFPNANIEVIGHSDARPIMSDLNQLYPTNWELSAVRASKVARTLIDAGVTDQQMVVISKAANSPIREEANAEAWQINRRIEIVFD